MSTRVKKSTKKKKSTANKNRVDDIFERVAEEEKEIGKKTKIVEETIEIVENVTKDEAESMIAELQQLPSTPSLLPTRAELYSINEMAQIYHESGFFRDKCKNIAQVKVLLLKGRGLNIDGSYAMTNIEIIKGKVGANAELIMSLILTRYPKAIKAFKLTSTECVIAAQRPGMDKPTVFTFDINDAKKAGLMTKDNYQKWIKAMLKARCSTLMGRSLFPDCLKGISYVKEELE